MLVAVEGCAHGSLGNIYASLEASPQRPDLLICCGDFQSVRNGADLAGLAAPQQHRHAGDFHMYFSGQRRAPFLTVFIGGNHEASAFLQELPYGGWVAHNIFYLGHAGVINVAGVRIAGISGIYKGHDYLRGHFEIPPYTESTKRSIYHIRNLEIFRLQQLSGKVDVCLSHDWPQGIVYHGDMEKLLQIKPYFREDIEKGQLGSPPCEELLYNMRPDYWFAAHMHCHFAAIVPHAKTNTKTKFLALDKCLPRRKFLQLIEIPHDESATVEIKYDLEWLTILRITNHLLSTRQNTCHMPGSKGNERFNFTPTDEEKKETLELFGENLTVPSNFEMTAKSFEENGPFYEEPQAGPALNPQTTVFCDLLKIDDPVSLIALQTGSVLMPYVAKLPSKPAEAPPIPLKEPSDSELFIDDREHDKTEEVLRSPPVAVITPMKLPTPHSTHEPIDIEETNEALIVGESVVSSSTSEMEPDTTMDSPVLGKRTFKRRNENLYRSFSEDD